jgi:hypothetical protein
MLSVIYSECHLFRVSFMLSVTVKHIVLITLEMSTISFVPSILSVNYAECHLC